MFFNVYDFSTLTTKSITFLKKFIILKQKINLKNSILEERVKYFLAKNLLIQNAETKSEHLRT